MNELSLFSGAGGGLLATKHLLGWITIGYVEIDDYCQKILIQRIKDGYLDPAPIFGDIKQFIAEGYAEAYQGMVDVITAGFPCQPFSVAGKQQGENDPRNMWPSTIEAIRIVRPRFCFLENVPGLLASSHGYFGTILQGLAEAGYDARWCCLGACTIGCSHLRPRLFVVAHAYNSHGWRKCWWKWRNEISKRAGNLRAEQNKSEPIRMVDAVAHRVDRLRATANGQVPLVVEVAWKVLTQ